MSMPSKASLTNSITDSASQSPPNKVEKANPNCKHPHNPIPSTSTADLDRTKDSIKSVDCEVDPSNCTTNSLPLGHTKSYLCSCNSSVIEDPKPGPSTTAAEFDLEVFDSCSSCSLEDCWGPDCHNSSCESSPIAGTTNTPVLIRTGGRNKSFHRKGNKRQLNGSSGVPERGVGLGINKPGTSSGIIPLGPHSKPNTSSLGQTIIDHSKTTIGDFSDNSSEEDFNMSSPGRALATHVGHTYEPTSACPSETEEANLSDGREDEEGDEKDGSIYRRSVRNRLPDHATINLQELSNETSMPESNQDEVGQLTDVEEEDGQDKEINAAAIRENTKSTSITSHDIGTQREHTTCTKAWGGITDCANLDKGGLINGSRQHCQCHQHNSETSEVLQSSYCTSKPECQEGPALPACNCSQTSLGGAMQIPGETKPTGNHLGNSMVLTGELPSTISCTSTTDYAHIDLNDAHPCLDDNNDNQGPKISEISSQTDQPYMPERLSDQPSAEDWQNSSGHGPANNKTPCNTITQSSTKASPLPSTSASANISSPHLPHCHCHAHVQHHHHHHLHHHVSVHPPLDQADLTLNIEPDQNRGDAEINEKTEDKPGIQVHKHSNNAVNCTSASNLQHSRPSNKSPPRVIQGTTQDTMSADNIDEILQDHDIFGTDENEDSLDSVATLSLNETTNSQEDEDGMIQTSFDFDKGKQKIDVMTPTLNPLEADSAIENSLDASLGLSGIKRKPDECEEDVTGPSNVKKKRTNIINCSNGNMHFQAASLIKTTPTSAPRNSHTNPISSGTRGVSDVIMASTAFHLEDDDDDQQDHEDEVRPCRQPETCASKQRESSERCQTRSSGRQRYWSAGTLHTEEEICSVAGNQDKNCASRVTKTKQLDSLDIVPDLSTCEAAALALPCSISTSKNVFANTRYICRHSIKNCCVNDLPHSCPNTSSNQRICLSEQEKKTATDDSPVDTASNAYPIPDNALEDDMSLTSTHDDVETCETCDQVATESSAPNNCFQSSFISVSKCLEGTCCANTPQLSHSTQQQQQLMKIIPDKNHPPDDILNWKDNFTRWSNAKRLLAIDQLIGICEPQQVRHMMAVIEPQFQRDFISLLPKELALYVLTFLKPRDLLNAAQTCRYWRILAEDNLLWREKCREAGLGDSVAEMFNARAKAHCKKLSNQNSIDYCPWKLGFMREHNIESNWRIRPIRTPKVLKGHDDHVITCLQFSNNRIVSGSDDNTLKVWNASTGRCLRTLVGHTGGVWSSQMEGNIIVSGSTDRSLKVWNADTGECVHTLYGHTSTVRCMHLHNNLVVSGSRDATLRMWDISSGECLHVLMGHVAAVRCVQYDGRLVVSGAYDYMVKVWNPITEECLHTLSGHTNRVYSLQFDGVHVVSGSLDTSIRVWDVETGSCKHALMGHQSLTSGMELKDNILVSGNADSTVKVWDITNGQCLQTLSGPNKHQSAVTCLQFDSKFVVTSSDDGTVKLWDVKTGDFLRDLVALKSGGSGGVVWRIRANATKLVCAVGSRNGTEETKLLVLDFDATVEK